VLYMAVPRLAEEKPFFLLDPEQLIDSPRNASSIKGASRSAKTVDVEDLEPVDLVVAGCVAVGKDGARLGKGGGFLLVSLARCGPGYPARGRSLAGELPTLASAHSGRRAAASPSSKACHPGRESRIVREWRASRRAAAGYPGRRASATRKEGLPVT
jgi:hypothetical protein